MIAIAKSQELRLVMNRTINQKVMNAWNSANIRIIGCIELLLLNLFYRKTVQDLYIKTFLFELFHLRRIQKFIVLFEILQGVSFKKYQQAFAVTFIYIPLTLLFFLLLSYYFIVKLWTKSIHSSDCSVKSSFFFSHIVSNQNTFCRHCALSFPSSQVSSESIYSSTSPIRVSWYI